MANLEENKTVILRLYSEISKGNLKVAGELIIEDYARHSTLPINQGRAGFMNFFNEFVKAFPDARFKVEDLIAEGDRVAARVVGRMTHRGDFMGVAPSGKTITIHWIDIFRLSGGKIVEHWDEVDQLGFLRQLGVIRQ